MGTRQHCVLVASFVLGLVIAACSSGDDLSLELPPETIPVTTSTTQGSTSIATTTPSTTDTPEPTYSAKETAVREAHTRFMTVINADDNGVERIRPLIEQYVIDPQRTRMLEGIEEDLATGNRSVGPGYDSNIIKVVFRDEIAIVGDCSIDRGQLFSPEGELLIPAAEIYTVRETDLVDLDGQWMVTEFRTGTRIGCDPDGPPWNFYNLP